MHWLDRFCLGVNYISNFFQLEDEKTVFEGKDGLVRKGHLKLSHIFHTASMAKISPLGSLEHWTFIENILWT